MVILLERNIRLKCPGHKVTAMETYMDMMRSLSQIYIMDKLCYCDMSYDMTVIQGVIVAYESKYMLQASSGWAYVNVMSLTQSQNVCIAPH